jgi:hypothetical protein
MAILWGMGGNPVFYRIVNTLTWDDMGYYGVVKWLTRIGLDSMVVAIPLRVASKNIWVTFD